MATLADLEPKALAMTVFDRADAERVIGSPDLVGVGMLGESARKARHGNRVTYLRVCRIDGPEPTDIGAAGEVRIVAVPASADEAVRLVGEVAGFSGTTPLTGFSLDHLLALVGGDLRALVELASALGARGLEAVAAVPLDRFSSAEAVLEATQALVRGGLRADRATIEEAPFEARLGLIERAERVARESRGFVAFAPLPERDPAEMPSTGYDDVRTVVLARLCTSIQSIQVSWALYGPKLAQVAIAYGADDLDGVAPVDTVELGHRRSPREDIERQIRAAFAEPIERDGRFELKS